MERKGQDRTGQEVFIVESVGDMATQGTSLQVEGGLSTYMTGHGQDAGVRHGGQGSH
jgi:hypothetical protein